MLCTSFEQANGSNPPPVSRWNLGHPPEMVFFSFVTAADGYIGAPNIDSSKHLNQILLCTKEFR